MLYSGVFYITTIYIFISYGKSHNQFKGKIKEKGKKKASGGKTIPYAYIIISWGIPFLLTTTLVELLKISPLRVSNQKTLNNQAIKLTLESGYPRDKREQLYAT